MPNYEIKICGRLDKRWQRWFDEAQVTVEKTAGGAPVTTIRCPADQVKLRGMLNKIWDLNLELISVRRLDYNSGAG